MFALIPLKLCLLKLLRFNQLRLTVAIRLLKLYKVFWKDDRPNNHTVTIFHEWLKENVLDHYKLSLDNLPILKDFLWSCQLAETDTPPNGRMGILAGLVSEKAIEICEYILNSFSPTLVLNADYQPLSYYPLSVWSWQDAIKAVFLKVYTLETLKWDKYF